MKQAMIGAAGLAVMGANLARNLERNGFSCAVWNRSEEKLTPFLRDAAEGKNFLPCRDVRTFCGSLARPRKILMMVKAGPSVDELIDSFLPFLEEGDILIDGGNSRFFDTERRVNDAARKGILYVGAGISGGETGALNGPSIMPGGNPEAWPILRPILRKIAAKAEADGAPCCEWIGPGGSGHYVKMVHNGIEYADMQTICEAYWLLKRCAGLSAKEMQEVFAAWNETELNSYLIEIAARILGRTDPETGALTLDSILDAAGQKGTGKWTAESALDLSVAAPTLAEAVFARFLSAEKELRVELAAGSPVRPVAEQEDRRTSVEQTRQALLASKICAYAQGFQLMRAASDRFGWNLNFAEIARIWRGGCIIRAAFLDRIAEAFSRDGRLPNLLSDDYFRSELARCESGWRGATSRAILTGTAAPAFASALTWFDSMTSAVLPANLLQAMRDFFGAHAYERTDRPRGEFFHTNWEEP